MKKKRYNNQSIRFKRWNRKANAVFLSLSRCVTIGCLSQDIANASLKKQKQLYISIENECEYNQEYADHEVVVASKDISILALLQLEQILNTQAKAQENAAGLEHCIYLHQGRIHAQ